MTATNREILGLIEGVVGVQEKDADNMAHLISLVQKLIEEVSTLKERVTELEKNHGR